MNGPHKQIFVVGNCQSQALSQTLALCCPQVVVPGCNLPQFLKEPGKWLSILAQSDFLVTLPVNLEAIDRSGFRGETIIYPGFVFTAFHKDLTFVFDDAGAHLNGPLRVYHSKLVYSAWRAGLSQRDAARLFNADAYRVAGYFDGFSAEFDRLTKHFERHDLDLRPSLLKWLRRGIVPYTVNHPRMAMVGDISYLLASKMNLEPIQHGIVPPDYLANGPIFPVYPEIAEHFGLSCGSYFFKPPQIFSLLTLPQFIAASYQVYAGYDPSRVLQHSYGKRTSEAFASDLWSAILETIR